MSKSKHITLMICLGLLSTQLLAQPNGRANDKVKVDIKGIGSGIGAISAFIAMGVLWIKFLRDDKKILAKPCYQYFTKGTPSDKPHTFFGVINDEKLEKAHQLQARYTEISEAMTESALQRGLIEDKARFERGQAIANEYDPLYKISSIQEYRRDKNWLRGLALGTVVMGICGLGLGIYSIVKLSIQEKPKQGNTHA